MTKNFMSGSNRREGHATQSNVTRGHLDQICGLRGRLHPAAEKFRDAPCLGDAAARDVRFLRIEDFADRAQAGFAEMLAGSVREKRARRHCHRDEL